MTASLRILSSKADSNTWESFTRSELKLESVHQESPRSDIFRKTKPLLKQNQHQKHLTWAKEKKNWTVAQWSKVLFPDKSKFCISFGNQGPRVWRKTGEESKLLEVQCEVSTVSNDLGCSDICWCWSTVFYQVQSQHSHLPGDFGALYASICWQALWRCWFHFPAPAHSSKTTSKWLADHDITVFDWSANTADLNNIWNLWYIFKRNSWFNNTIKGSIVPQQCHRLIAFMPQLSDSLICAKGALTKWECINERTLKNFNFFVLQIIFFLLISGNILIFWDTGCFTFMRCKL